MRVREYAGPLGVIAAGVVGFSLLCTMSALAMSDLDNHEHARVKALNILDLAVENLGTSAALTQQAVTAFVSTPTILPTDTGFFTPIPPPSETDAASATPLRSTATRRPQAADTAKPPPTRTRTPPPPDTSTPVPPTHTHPPPTNTEAPPPTDTSAPPPPNTEPPPATDTPSTGPELPLPPTSVPVESMNSTPETVP